MAGEDPRPAKSAGASKSGGSKRKESRSEISKTESSRTMGSGPEGSKSKVSGSKVALVKEENGSDSKTGGLIQLPSEEVHAREEQLSLQPDDGDFAHGGYLPATVQHGGKAQILQQDLDASPAENSDLDEHSQNKTMLYTGKENHRPSELHMKQSQTEKSSLGDVKNKRDRKDGETRQTRQRNEIKASNPELQHKQSKLPNFKSSKEPRMQDLVAKRASSSPFPQTDDNDRKLDGDNLSPNAQDDAEYFQYQSRQDIGENSNTRKQRGIRLRELLTLQEGKDTKKTANQKTSQETNQKLREQTQNPRGEKSRPKATDVDVSMPSKNSLDRVHEPEKNTNEAITKKDLGGVHSVKIQRLGNVIEQNTVEWEPTQRGLHNEIGTSEQRKGYSARETSSSKGSTTEVENELIAQLNVSQEKGDKVAADPKVPELDAYQNLKESKYETEASQKGLELQTRPLSKERITSKKNSQDTGEKLASQTNLNEPPQSRISQLNEDVTSEKILEKNFQDKLKVARGQHDQVVQQLEKESSAANKALPTQVRKLQMELNEKKDHLLFKGNEWAKERSIHEAQAGEQTRNLETQRATMETEIQDLQNELKRLREEGSATAQKLQDTLKLQPQQTQFGTNKTQLELRVIELEEQQDSSSRRESDLQAEVKRLNQKLKGREAKALSLDQETKKLSEELERLQSVKSTMGIQIAERDAKELKLNEEIKKLQSVKSTMVAQIAERDTKEVRLEKESNELRSVKNAMGSQIVERNAIELKLNEEIKKLRLQLKELQSIKATADIKIGDLQHQTEGLNNDKVKIASKVQQLEIWETRAGALEKQVKDLKGQLGKQSDLQNQLEEMGKDIVSWKEKNKELDEQVQSLKGEESEWEGEKLQLDNQVKSLQQQQRKYEGEKDVLEGQIRDLSHDQAKVAAQPSLFANEKNQWEETKSALNARLQTLQKEKNDLIEKNIGLDNDLKVLQSQSNLLVANKVSLDQDFQSLKSENGKWATEKTEMRKQLSELSERQEIALASQRDEWTSDKTALTLKIGILESEKTELENQLSERMITFDSQGNKWSSIKASLTTKIKTLESEKTELVRQLELSKQQGITLAGEANKWSSAKAALTVKVKSLDSERTELKTQLSELSEQKKIDLVKQEDEWSIVKAGLTTKIKTHESEKTELIHQLELSKQKETGLSRQKNEWSIEKETLTGKIKGLELGKAELSHQLDLSKQQEIALGRHKNQWSSDKAALTMQIRALESAKTELENQLSQRAIALSKREDEWLRAKAFLTTKIKTHESEKIKLEQMCQGFKEEHDRQQLEQVMETNSLEKQLENLSQLRSENITLNAQVKSLRHQKDQLESENSQLNKTAENLQQLHREQAEWAAKANGLENQIQDLQRQKHEWDTKTNALERQLEDLQQLELKNTTLSVQVQRLNTQVQVLQRQEGQLESGKTQMNETIQVLQQEKLERTAKLDALERQLKSLPQLEREKTTLSAQVRKLNTQVQELQHREVQLESEKTKLSKIAQDLQRQKIEWSNKTNALELQLRGLSELESEKTQLNKIARDQKTYWELENTKLKQTNLDLQQQKVQLEVEKTQLMKTAQEIQQLRRKQEAEWTAKAKNQLEDLKQQKVAWNATQQDLIDKAALVVQEKDKVEALLADLQDQHCKFAKQASGNLQELERLRALQISREEQMRNQSQELRNLQEKYEDVCQKAAESQKQFESLKVNHSEQEEAREVEGTLSRSQFLGKIQRLEEELRSSKRERGPKVRQGSGVPCPHNLNHWVAEKASLQDLLEKLQDQRDKCAEDLADCQNQCQEAQQSEKQLNSRLVAAESRHRLLELDLQEIRFELEGESQKLQQSESALQDHVEKLEAQAVDLVKLNGILPSLQSEVEAQKAEIEKMKEEQAKGTTLETQLQRKIESDAIEIRKFRETIGAQEERIKRIQEDFFRTGKKAVRETIEEKMLESYIRKEVVEPTNDWSVKFVRRDGNLSDFERESPDTWHRLQQISQDFHRTAVGEAREYQPQILLNYLLADYIYENVINHPFLQLNDEGFGNEMEHLYKRFRAINEAEAHAWRLQTLNFVMPMQARDRPEFWGNDIAWNKEQVKGFQPSYCWRLASDFIQGPAQTLIERSSLGGQLHQDLVDVFQAAGWFGSALWRQFETLKPLGFEDLKEKKFSCKSVEMEWDRIHRLDPGEDRLDGHGIMMVVQPGFVGISTEDGGRKPQEKVLSKAVVF